MSDDHPRVRPGAIFRPIFALFDGISGRDRQKALGLRAKLDEARQDSVRLQKEVSRLKRDLEQQHRENQGLDRSNHRLTSRMDEAQQQEKTLKEQCDRLQSEQAKLRKDLTKRSRETQSLEQNLAQLRKEQDNLQQQNQQRQTDLEDLRQTNQKLRYSENQLQKQVKKLQTSEEKLKLKLENKQGQQREARQEIEEYENWIQRVETENAELGKRCDGLELNQATVGANLENTYNQLQAFNQRLRHESPEAWQSFSGLWKSLNLEALLPITEEESDELPDVGSLDLSGWRLALVGGHDSTRRGVTEVLGRYGLHNIIEVPPANQNKIDQGRVKEKIDRCDLVVVITGYLSHKMTKIIHNLYHQNALAGELLYLNCRGCSGVVRDIVAYVQSEGLQSQRPT